MKITSIANILQKLKTKLSSSAGNLILAQSTATVVLFIVDIIFARVFSKELFGTWKHLLLLSNLVIPLASFGAIEGARYYSSLEKKQWNKHFYSVAVIVLIEALILFLILNLGGDRWLAEFLNNPQILSFSGFLPFLFVFISFGLIYRDISIVIGRTRLFLTASIISMVISFMGYILIVQLSEPDESIVIFWLVMAFLIGHVIRWILMQVKIKPLFSLVTIEKVKGYFTYGLPLYLTSFITIIVLNTDKSVISYFGDTESFAVFSVGAKEIPFLAIIGSSFYRASYPTLVEKIKLGEHLQAKTIWLEDTLKVSQLIFPFVLVLMLISKPLVILMYGEDYTGAVSIFQTYLLIMFWRNNYYGALLSAAGKTKWITFYSVITMIVNVLLSVWFYQIWGTIGVVYATLISVTTANSLQLLHENLLSEFLKSFVKKPLLLGYILATIIVYFAAS